MTSRAGAFFGRPTSTSRDVTAGCFVCNGFEAMWRGGNAQGVAARHHDATGHATWCDVYMLVRYGTQAPDVRQTDIEDAIAASSVPNDPPAADDRRRAARPASARRPRSASAHRHLHAPETQHA